MACVRDILHGAAGRLLGTQLMLVGALLAATLLLVAIAAGLVLFGVGLGLTITARPRRAPALGDDGEPWPEMRAPPLGRLPVPLPLRPRRPFAEVLLIALPSVVALAIVLLALTRSA